MTNRSRIFALAAAVVVLVVAFFVLSPKDDDEASTSGSTTTEPTRTAPPTATTTEPTATTRAPARPGYEVVRVRDGKPVGGIRRIEVDRGDRARIEVSSSDTSDEIHLHGYDLSKDLEAGGRVRFNFVAKSDGIYEIELEGAGVQIAELVVEP